MYKRSGCRSGGDSYWYRSWFTRKENNPFNLTVMNLPPSLSHLLIPPPLYSPTWPPVGSQVTVPAACRHPLQTCQLLPSSARGPAGQNMGCSQDHGGQRGSNPSAAWSLHGTQNTIHMYPSISYSYSYIGHTGVLSARPGKEVSICTKQVHEVHGRSQDSGRGVLVPKRCPPARVEVQLHTWVVLLFGGLKCPVNKDSIAIIIHYSCQIYLRENAIHTSNKDGNLRILLRDKVGIDTRDRDCHITVVHSIVIQLNISNSQRFVQWVNTVLSLWSCGIKRPKAFPPTECV